MNKVKSIVALFIFLFCISVFAGPFGLEMGMSIKQIDPNAKEIAPYIYKIQSVPKPHSAFESYVLKVSPNCGLCLIKANGKDISTNTYGVELKSSFYDMKERLEKVYGISETTDVLFPGSIWDEPNDWMMGILKDERILCSFWEKEKGLDLKDNINIIVLGVSAINQNKGYLILEYSFINKENCDKEISDLEDSAF